MKAIFIASAIGSLLAVLSQCAFAEAGWYPRGTDMCAQYVVNATQHGTGKKLVTPTKDPAIARYVHDFNGATGTKDKGGLALVSLLVYCTSHGGKRLSEVSAGEVIAEVRAAENRSSKSSSATNTDDTQVQWQNWYKQGVSACGSDAQCSAMVTKTYEDGVQCAQGNSEACSRAAQNTQNVSSWDTQHPGSATTRPAENSMVECLQNAVRSAVASCAGCAGDVLFEVARKLQQASCGYSALEPIATPSNTGSTTCRTTPVPGGGWTTTCSQY